MTGRRPNRRTRDQAATSLDGDIAGSKGNAARIITDPDVDLAARLAGLDTLLVGRRTLLLRAPREVRPRLVSEPVIFSRFQPLREVVVGTAMRQPAQQQVNPTELRR